MSAPHLSEQMHDIQGMLRSGFGWLQCSRFWLLTIKDGRENDARAWLGALVQSGLIVSARDIGRSRSHPVEKVAAIAFSHSGLTKLGCNETKAHPFPTPFRSGMGSDLRALLLRDKPRQWRWSDADGTGCPTVHVLIAEWGLRDAGSALPDIDHDIFGVIKIDNDPKSFRDDGKLREAFNFRDGLAQPVIRGLRQDDGVGLGQASKEAGPLYEDRVVSPGEFILGYRNEYDELTYCPNMDGWTQSGRANHPGGRFALNGSYLAARQIEQKVEAFDAFRAANGKDICEKLMGRQQNGLPLGWEYDPSKPISDSKADAFRYRVEDANGFLCPKGAHIRRVNPRDTLGVDVQSSIKSTKLHRLIRRGRPYREETKGQAPRNGIFFIACNADLERQFEFIHQRWLRNPRFVGLNKQDDPLVGSPASSKPFSIPGLASGKEVSLADFTQTQGGGYFFLPGLAALKFIVGLPADAKVTASDHAEPASV